VGHQKFPSQSVSIRAIDAERYKIIDLDKNDVIEEVEESKAFFQVRVSRCISQASFQCVALCIIVG
jgi:hypothetical protein